MLLIALELLLLVAGAAAGCSSEGCAAAVAPVCGADGLTYMNECLASCQGVAVVAASSCEAAAGAAAVHIPAAMFAQAPEGELAVTSEARTLPAAAITAYHEEGMRMVGVLQRSSFRPAMPAVEERDMQELMSSMSTAPSSQGTTMMVNSKGHLYAAPLRAAPSSFSQDDQPAAALQGQDGPSGGSLIGGSSSSSSSSSGSSRWDHLAPSEATAPPDDSGDETDDAADDLLEELEAATTSTTTSSSSGNRRRLTTAAAAAAGVGRKLRGIIGPDTRKELRSLKYPFSAAGHLMFTNPDDAQRYQCSATLVGTYVVLTAAHCVVARSGAVQQDITFTAAETSRNHDGLGAANGLRVYFNSGYLSSGAEWMNWDLGMVVLDQPLGVNSPQAFQQELQAILAASGGRRSHSRSHSRRGERRGEAASVAGTVGYAAMPRLVNTETVSAGYPGDKPMGSAWLMTCSLTDPDTSGASNVVPNKCPIVNGQSGSSLIEARSLGGATRHYIRGVVSFEVCQAKCDGGCCGGKAQYNGVLKITPFFQGFIDSHRNDRPSGDDSAIE